MTNSKPTVDLEKHYDAINKLFAESVEEKFANVYLIMAHDKEAIEDARKIALVAAEKNESASKEANDKHFALLNGAAKTQEDFKNTYIAKIEFFPTIDTIKTRLDTIETDKKIADAVVRSKASQVAFFISLFFAVASFVISLLNFLRN